MSIEIIGYVPHTRDTDTSGLWWSQEFDADYILEVARAHETAGYDAVLIGAGSWGPDSAHIATFLLQNTQKIKILIAQRPGFIQPTLAARQLVTLSRLYGPDRVGLHIITGSKGGELTRDGDTLDPSLRYARSAEYMRILRDVWQSERPFDHHGNFYDINQGFSAIRPAGNLRLSFAGSSDEALEIAATEADLYMIWGEPLRGVQEIINKVLELTPADGIPTVPSFCVSLRAVIAKSEEGAWDRARKIYDEAKEQLNIARQAPESLQQNAYGLSSVGAQRLDSFAKDKDVEDERLWLGFTRLAGRGGSTSALVGTLSSVVEAYLKYYDLGVRSFYIRGWNIKEDALEYGSQLIPALRKAVEDRSIS